MLPIHSLDDPRIEPYRNLKERELAQQGGRFIAEGELILRRLLASDFPVESILLSQRRAKEIEPLAPEGVPVYVAADEILRQIIGYKFQSGVIAVGHRKPRGRLEQIVRPMGERSVLVVCPEIASAQNMGSLIRIAAAFGADAMLLGERCCDPFWRQSIRVSMGAVFSLPMFRSENLADDLRALASHWDYQLIATVLDSGAQPLIRFKRRPRIAVLVGNEAQGLDEQSIAACDTRLTIPMRQGVDSLNVAVATGIFLHSLTSQDEQG